MQNIPSEYCNLDVLIVETIGIWSGGCTPVSVSQSDLLHTCQQTELLLEICDIQAIIFLRFRWDELIVTNNFWSSDPISIVNMLVLEETVICCI